MNIKITADDFSQDLGSTALDLFSQDKERRKDVIEMSHKCGVEVRVENLRDDELSICSESFLASRSIEIASDDGHPRMSLGLSLEGDFAYRWCGMRQEQTCRAGTLQLWNGGGPGYCRFEAGTRTRMLGIAVSPQYLERLLRTCSHLEELMSPFPSEDPFSLLPHNMPLGAHIQGIVRSLQESPLMGAAAHVYRDAKLLELFAMLLDVRTGNRETRAHGLRSYDEERLQEARAILLRRVLDPPSIPELSRLVGINECKLKKGFRTLFGNSVYGLLFEHRMTLARDYLLDTDKPVQEIAGLCGYEHVSHFSTAFRRGHGKSPVAFRSSGR